MGLWEEAFRDICGSMQLWSQESPSLHSGYLLLQLIAMTCLWLICRDVTGHYLNLALDQQLYKASQETLWAATQASRHPSVRYHPQGNQQSMCGTSVLHHTLRGSFLIRCLSF